MATTRKRSTSGFAPREESTEETVSDFQEESAAEQTLPVVIEDIVPEPEPEPVSVEPAPKPPVAVSKPVVLNPPPKRHPRNIPKFSAHK